MLNKIHELLGIIKPPERRAIQVTWLELFYDLYILFSLAGAKESIRLILSLAGAVILC